MSVVDLTLANSVLSELLTNPDISSASTQPNTDVQLLISPLLDESQRHQQSDWAAHMSPSLAPYSLLGLQLAALHGGNLLSPELYPLLKQAENETLSWLKKLFHQQYGHFTHGSSYGNLEALWKARDTSHTTRKKVYASAATHYSVIKACQILGLEFVALPYDNQGKLDISALEIQCRQEAPLAIVINMGTTASGVIDPINRVNRIASEFAAWLHIDAAWGGALMLLPDYVESLLGVQQADSICFDPHKSLYQPKPCSVILYRHPSQQIETSTHYLTTPPENIVPGSYGGEIFLPLWLNLQLLGTDWFCHRVRSRLEQAQRFTRLLNEASDWQVFNSETGLVCFQPADMSVLATLIQKGIFSSAELNGTKFFRAVFAGINTQADSLFKALRPFL